MAACSSKKTLYRNVSISVVGSIGVILTVVLIAWLILRPQKPQFVLQDATIYAFNLSAASLLTSTLQLTLASRNPNSRMDILYDGIRVSASYYGHQITLPTQLPAGYQGQKEVTVWSPLVYGIDFPLSPNIALSLTGDQAAGIVLINVVLGGGIRWKVGSFVSGRYRLNVDCPAYFNMGNVNNGIAVGQNVIKYQLILECHVNV